MKKTAAEILEKYQVRKTKKQKSAFIEYASARIGEMGYPMRVERGPLGVRNIVVGDLNRARVVYTAHYDTAPRLPMPNFITPRSIPIYVLYQIILMTVIYGAAVLIGSLLSTVIGTVALLAFPDMDVAILVSAIMFGTVIAVCLLVMFGPANKHTANDNTSGVTTLLVIMSELPPELRDSVAFVFFDQEEIGLVGSKSFSKKHRVAIHGKLVVNFDCVSDGDNILLAVGKGAAGYADLLRECFTPDAKYSVDVATRGVFYPSDQACFKCGVGVAALKRGFAGVLYMNRIHTSRDVIYNEENIDFLVARSIILARCLAERPAV